MNSKTTEVISVRKVFIWKEMCTSDRSITVHSSLLTSEYKQLRFDTSRTKHL